MPTVDMPGDRNGPPGTPADSEAAALIDELNRVFGADGPFPAPASPPRAFWRRRFRIVREGRRVAILEAARLSAELALVRAELDRVAAESVSRDHAARQWQARYEAAAADLRAVKASRGWQYADLARRIVGRCRRAVRRMLRRPIGLIRGVR